ncbi:hypothetical protein VIGAN_04300800, partial [Vigna angularis var. angularis]
LHEDMLQCPFLAATDRRQRHFLPQHLKWLKRRRILPIPNHRQRDAELRLILGVLVLPQISPAGNHREHEAAAIISHWEGQLEHVARVDNAHHHVLLRIYLKRSCGSTIHKMSAPRRWWHVGRGYNAGAGAFPGVNFRTRIPRRNTHYLVVQCVGELPKRLISIE